MNPDARLISEVGIKLYLQSKLDQPTSNIDFSVRGPAAEKRWEECDFGCHGPSYRSIKRHSDWHEVVGTVDNVHPFLGGVVDGFHHQLINKPLLAIGGVKRTTEGLYLHGSEPFRRVGSENWAVVDLASSTLRSLFEADLSLLDNPLTQMIYVIVFEYIHTIPADTMDEMIAQGVLKFPDGIDKDFLSAVIKYGLTEGLDSASVNAAIKALETNAKIQQGVDDLKQAAKEAAANKVQHSLGRLVGGIEAQKIAKAVAAAIASAIVRRIVNDLELRKDIGRRIGKLLKMKKIAGRGLYGAFTFLLSSQGWLDKSSQDSQILLRDCPRLWNYLRYRLNGSDMLYFLIEQWVREYIDRLSVLEHQPDKFKEAMSHIIRAKMTKAIFYPGLKDKKDD